MDNELGDIESGEAGEDKEVSESRRKFLLTAGKISMYTAPAMALLTSPSNDAFAQSSGAVERPRRHRRRRRDNDNDNDNG